MMRVLRGFLLLAVAALPLQSLAAGAGGAAPAERWWLGIGAGGGAINSLATGAPQGRAALGASIEIGRRFTPQWGLGVELGAIAPLSGCRELHCGNSPSDFAPSLSRLFAFGEFRPAGSGLRLRAGVGVSRFCHQRHWDEDAWSVFDTLNLILDEDYPTHTGSGAYRCDASRRALGGAVSVGYDWDAGQGSPAAVGIRLTGEAAGFAADWRKGLPLSRHRAVMLSIHLRIQ